MKDTDLQLTVDEKNSIINEAKGVISDIIHFCEKPEPELLKELFADSPDFVSMVGGIHAEYDQSLKNVDGYFANVARQKATVLSEKYVVLDASTILYTADSSWEVYLKNDSKLIMDPTGMQFILRKYDNRWKVISWTEEVIMKQ